MSSFIQSSFWQTKHGIAIRWLAFVPMFLLVALIANILFYLVVQVFYNPSGGFQNGVVQLIKPLFILGPSLVLGCYVAPKPKVAFVVLLFTFTILLSVGITYMSMSDRFNFQPLTSTLNVLGFTLAFLATWANINGEN